MSTTRVWSYTHRPLFDIAHTLHSLHTLKSKPFFTSARTWNQVEDDPSTRPLRQRYPTSPLSPIFESISSEYLAPSTSTSGSGSGSTYVSRRGSDLLRDAVREERYDDALILHREILASGESIPPSITYISIILHILRSPTPPSSRAALYASVLDWFTLLPSRSSLSNSEYSNLKTNLHNIKYLMTQYMDDLHPLARMAIIGAGKGYGRFFAKDLVRTVVYLTEPGYSEKFYREFEAAASACAEREGSSEAFEERRAVWRSRVVVAYAMSGRLAEAQAILHESVNEGIIIQTYAYSILGRHLKLKRESTEAIEELFFLQHSTPLRIAPIERKARLKREAAPIFLTTHSLALALRTLRKSIISPSAPPSQTYLSTFLSSCLTNNRLSPIRRLRRKAMRDSRRSAQLWLMSEMGVYRGRREWEGVVWVFWRYFWMVGVCRALVERVLAPHVFVEHWPYRDHPSHDSLNSSPASASGTGMEEGGGEGMPTTRRRKWSPILPGEEWVLSGRLVPSSYVTTMVWEALMALSDWKRGPSLGDVYRAFRGEAERQFGRGVGGVKLPGEVENYEGEGGEGEAEGFGSVDTPELGAEAEQELELEQEQDSTSAALICTPPSARFDASHFVRFMIALGKTKNPWRARFVWRDLRSLGVRENVYVWNVMIRVYIRSNKLGNAMELVKEMLGSGLVRDISVDDTREREEREMVKEVGFREAKWALKKMKMKESDVSVRAINGYVPRANLVTLQVLMGELERCGWVDMAREVGETLSEMGYSVVDSSSSSNTNTNTENIR
ncbi:hypothetical protein SISSUDRAFT_245596 [Sistotremastrum suecicum HHB10207 ss-3]|uniref:Pentacotripeptide-repeat region of PRORP domain-containing protein n=1 Tax=Sistotremastrum suecicum HHB10207 ss-3 TaxID=1314776 RepID=A0A165ZYK6_9AGAM|nr:hypothetical protein SISSUDRAFT_245596 [Sistotremastrum suecicum HHB10207 ss-3]